MSTTATTAPAALTILSQLLLSMSVSLAPGALPGPAGTTGSSGGGRRHGPLRLRSTHVRDGLRRWGSPPDRGRDGARLGALARRGPPADRGTRSGPHGRALRSARRPDAGRPGDRGL